MTTLVESSDTKIAVMANDIAYIKKSQDRIEQSVKDLSNTYITKQEFDDVKIAQDSKIASLQRSSNIWKIVSPAVASVITAVIVFLLISFLQSAKV